MRIKLTVHDEIFIRPRLDVDKLLAKSKFADDLNRYVHDNEMGLVSTVGLSPSSQY